MWSRTRRPDAVAGRQRRQTGAVRTGILRPRQRRLAWVGLLLLAAYAPVVAWLWPDDTWLMPLTVAGLIGYVLIVDDVLRHRAARDAGSGPDTTIRGHRLRDDPESSTDAPSGSGQRPDR